MKRKWFVISSLATRRIPHSKLATRWSEIQDYHATHSLTETARRFGVTPPAIIYWKRKFGVISERQRFGGDELDELDEAPKKPKRVRAVGAPLASWVYPPAKAEARFLLHVARNNGGVDAMRRLISVTPREQTELERLVQCGQILEKRVQDAITFRAEVLREFDRLYQELVPSRKQSLGPVRTPLPCDNVFPCG